MPLAANGRESVLDRDSKMLFSNHEVSRLFWFKPSRRRLQSCRAEGHDTVEDVWCVWRDVQLEILGIVRTSPDLCFLIY